MTQLHLRLCVAALSTVLLLACGADSEVSIADAAEASAGDSGGVIPLGDVVDDLPAELDAKPTEDTPEEVGDVAEDPAADPANDAQADTVADVPDGSVEDAPTDASADTPDDAPADTPDDAPNDTPDDVPTDVQADTPEDTPADTSGDVSSDALEDVPQDLPDDSRGDIAPDARDVPPPPTCDEIEAEYTARIAGAASCEEVAECAVLFSHCGVGLGGCYAAANVGLTQEMLNEIAERWIGLGCPEGRPVCRCAAPPAAACNERGACDYAR